MGYPKYLPLDRAQEKLLAIKWRKNGDLKARERILASVSRLPEYVVKTFFHIYPRDQRFDSLIQAGQLGLLRAMDKFNPYAGFRFMPYAVWWVKTYVNRERYGRHRDWDESAKLYLDQKKWDDSDSTYKDLLEDPNQAPEPMLGLEEAENRELLASKIQEVLSDKERDVIRRRYYSKSEVTTLEEIGRIYGVSRERVRQVELTAITKLRVALQTEQPPHRGLKPNSPDSPEVRRITLRHIILRVIEQLGGRKCWVKASDIIAAIRESEGRKEFTKQLISLACHFLVKEGSLERMRLDRGRTKLFKQPAPAKRADSHLRAVS